VLSKNLITRYTRAGVVDVGGGFGCLLYNRWNPRSTSHVLNGEFAKLDNKNGKFTKLTGSNGKFPIFSIKDFGSDPSIASKVPRL
jgi:hypothetical protein